MTDGQSRLLKIYTNGLHPCFRHGIMCHREHNSPFTLHHMFLGHILTYLNWYIDNLDSDLDYQSHYCIRLNATKVSVKLWTGGVAWSGVGIKTARNLDLVDGLNEPINNVFRHSAL